VLQRASQIAPEIVHLVDADRQAQQRIADTQAGALLRRNARRSRRWLTSKISLLFEELQKQGQWIIRNYPAAAAQLVPLQGLDPAVVESSIRRYSNVVKPITDQVRAEQQKLADTFFELKLIPKEIRVNEAALPGKR
jgi:hypothetical protein